MSDVQKIKNVSTNYNFKKISKSTNSQQSNANIVNIITEPINDVVDETLLLSDSAFENVNYEKIEEDGFTPQGVTTIDNRLLISAYKKGELSRIYIYNSLTKEYEGKIILDNDAHVGGITYDKENKILFVTGSNGSVNAYNYELIEEAINEVISDFSFEDGYIVNLSNSNYVDEETGEYSFKIDSDININYNNKIDDSKAATVYYYNDRLYIGSFEGEKPGRLISYKIDYNKENNTIELSNIMEFTLPLVTQGIAITEYNGIQYLLTTQSIGTAKSSITIYEDFPNKDGKVKILFLDDIGIEGIEITDNKEIVAVFENGRTEVLSTNIDELKSKATETIEGKDVINLINQRIGGYLYENPEIEEAIDNIFK